MTLPLLLSVPHGGLRVPPEVADVCLLTPREVEKDGDEGAREIYALGKHVAGFVAADVARAIVDVNRAEDDIRKDGVIKTHTCWDVPVYRSALSPDIVQELIARYHRPYHRLLSAGAQNSGAVLGIDCHTMAATGPPVGPDAGRTRPRVCLSDADGTLPGEWRSRLADCLEESFGKPPALNDPFQGGYIIRSHASEMPWVQLELSRGPFMTAAEKRERVLAALQRFCRDL
jgi:formiminoglutamase